MRQLGSVVAIHHYVCDVANDVRTAAIQSLHESCYSSSAILISGSTSGKADPVHFDFPQSPQETIFFMGGKPPMTERPTRKPEKNGWTSDPEATA